ncbi:MAG: carboxypeptidase regulatory-like domain-containing protein, partial [Edaphobacter sp.]
MSRLFRLCSALFLLAVLAPSLHSQMASELKGRITDAAGAIIRSATVRATEATTHLSQTSTTTSEGYFVFAHLVPGVYQLDVDAAGFRHVTRTGITLMVGQTVAADIALPVGEQRQTVTVNADAPLLQSQTSGIQTSIPAATVAAIPLNTRNFVQLTTLAPGVELPPGTLLPRINGGRPRTNEYLFDGISALQPEPGQVAFFPILDDIQEFTVETDNVSAEFGRFNGGVVNVATRYGTNQFHGSLFEYFRNEALNARNYFSKAPARKPEYRRNLFGATLGGPVLHDRLFFFSDYQGVKQRIGVTRISTIPTLAMRRGIFTGVSNIYDPSTTAVVNGKYVRQQFSNNVINKPFDPAAVALLKRLPVPTNLSAIANNYTRTGNDDDHQNQFDLRIDGAIGRHDRAFGRYSYYNEVEQPVTPLPDGGGAITGSVLGSGNVAGLSNILGQQAVFNETHTFTNSIVNDLRLGYTRRGNTISGASLGDTASAALGIPGIPTNAAFNNALPLFTFTGFQQLGSSASTFSKYQTAVWQLTDTVLFTRGQHAIKIGADLRWYQLNAISPPDPTGSFAFTTTGTNQQGVTNTGNSFASFLLGQVDTFQIDLQRSKIRPRDHIEEYFVQDDWHVLPQLTLNIGARWTLHLPSTELNNQGAVFNLQTQQLDYLGQDGYSRSARQLHWGNVAPRIGFAYLLTPKTVIRSGFGIVFIDQSGITTPFTTPQFPFIQNVQQKTQDGVYEAFPLSSGPTVSPIPLTRDAGLGQSVYTVNRTAGSGYVQQWNLAIQHSITNNLSFDLAYVGSHIVHVGIPDSNLNQLTADQLASGLTNPTA